MPSTAIRLSLGPVTRRILWMGSVWMIAAMLSLIGLVMPNVIEADGPAAAYLFGDQIKPMLDDGVPIIYGPTGSAIASIGGGGLEWAVSDHLGSVRIKAERSHEYGPFGSVSSSDSVPVYAGHPYDPHPGIYQTPGRTYDPSLGRFLSVDPQRQGASPYPYAGGDPVNFLDPTGTILMPFLRTSGLGTSTTSDQRIKTLATALGYDSHLQDATRTFGQPVAPGERPKTSTANSRPERVLYGMYQETSRFNSTMYWIVGDEEPVKIPGDLKASFEKLRSKQPDFASSIVVIDVSKDHTAHRGIIEALQDIPGGRDVIIANLITDNVSIPGRTSHTRADVTTGITVKDYPASFDLPSFRVHAEMIATSVAVTLETPTTSAPSTNSTVSNAFATMGRGSGLSMVSSESGTFSHWRGTPVAPMPMPTTANTEFPSVPPVSLPTTTQGSTRTSSTARPEIWRPFYVD